MDFTLKTYKELLLCLKKLSFSFATFNEFTNNTSGKSIYLRHDVDRLPNNALVLAKLEYSLDIKSTYYFRILNHVFQPEIIKEIKSLGHEIGYHYEDYSLAKGDIKNAVKSFEKNLSNLRDITEINTLCMHGSPLNKWDNRKIWDTIDYHAYGLTLEPYYDINYNEFFYITDTGRKWNNVNINIRDKVKTKFKIKIKSTRHIIKLLKRGEIPNKIIINTHPHRWFEPGLMWFWEVLFQNIKNVIKRGINNVRH